MLRGRISRGFSLIEILVVVAIIGVFVGVTILSTDLVGLDRRLEQEARRLVTVLRFARDEGLLQSRDFAVYFGNDSYHFFIFDYDYDAWVPVEATDAQMPALDSRRFDQEILLALQLDDVDVILEREELVMPEPPGADDQFEQYLELLPDPHVFVLSSGEITPFRLEFLNRAEPFEPGVSLSFAFDGRWEVSRSEF